MQRSQSHGGGLAGGGGSGTSGDDAATLLRLLRTGGGEAPRRAVVGEGGVLCDRADAPAGSMEIGSVSAVCEVVRRMAGLPVWSRDSAQLAQQCLDTNAPGAWAALYSDVQTGDVDWPRLRAGVLTGGGVRVCVGCLLAPRDAAHLLHMTACLVAMTTDEDTRRGLASALGRKLAEFVDVLMRHNSVMRRDVRDGVLTALGRMLARVDVPVADAAAAMDRVLDRRHDDLVRLFTHLPVAEYVALLPGLVPKLVARARVASASSQYALLAALARAGAGSPEAVHPHRPQIADLVAATLAAQLASSGGIDARTLMVCGMLAQAAGPEAAGALAPLLAQALQRAAASLVEKA
jgi:hypothetical protein